jgi:RNA polymerase sigma-70 factor (ECF subfamily)
MVGLVEVRRWSRNGLVGAGRSLTERLDVGSPAERAGPDPRDAVGRPDAGEHAAYESHLLHAARAGDRMALERLLSPHERPLFNLCRGILGHADDAEDAVQETFLRALRALAGFRGDSAVRSWLFRIAVNVCLDWKRSHRPTEPLDEQDGFFPCDGPSPEAIVLRQLRVREALDALLPRHRALLLLKELEGWSAAEIAVTLRWKKKRVENELYQARRALADWRRRDTSEGDEP